MSVLSLRKRNTSWLLVYKVVNLNVEGVSSVPFSKEGAAATVHPRKEKEVLRFPKNYSARLTEGNLLLTGTANKAHGLVPALYTRAMPLNTWQPWED